MSERTQQAAGATGRRFRLHALFRLPDLAEALGGPVVAGGTGPDETVTHHYDTADLRLARSGIALSWSDPGAGAAGPSGWALSVPGDDEVKGAGPIELRLPGTPPRGRAPGGRQRRGRAVAQDDVRPAPAQVPEQFADLVTAYARREPLVPVASLATARTTTTLAGADGSVRVEVHDDTVSVLDGDRVAARFRELGLVAGPGGDAGAVERVAAAVLAGGAVEGSSAIASLGPLGPAASAPEDVPPPGPVTPSDPAGDAVVAHLARHTRALLRQDVRVRLDQPDGVHQMRVAARRLRSGLQAFAPLLDHDAGHALRDELRWAAGELGGVRDREVLRERLVRDTGRLPEGVDAEAAQRLVEHRLGDELAEHRDEALAALRGERYLDLLDALVRAVHEPPLTDAAAKHCSKALPPLVTKTWRRLARDAEHLLGDPSLTDPDDPGTDPEWHEARKAAKRVRYTLEACVPVFGGPAARTTAQVERITELLGEHQDAAVAADALHALLDTPRLGAPAGFALGLTYALQRRAVAEQRAAFAHVWPSVAKKRHRRWLAGPGS